MDPAKLHDEVLILDFGSQYSHLIARRIRELNVYCELHSCTAEASLLESKPHVKGVVLSGGPQSVYEEGAPHVRPEMWALIERRGLPVLGICYGLQELAFTFGGKVAASERREYGHAMVSKVSGAAGAGLFAGLGDAFQVWMSHGDKLHELPEGFHDVGVSENSEHCAIANTERRMYGLQFHPEVTHTPLGKDILRNFVVGVCGCTADWTMGNVVAEAVRAIQEQVGPDGHVVGAVSGGVDSTVASVLMTRAIGDRFHAVLVDNGLLREGEGEEVVERLRSHLGINLVRVDARERFLTALRGVEDPERKRKIIGHTFIDVFEDVASKLDPSPKFLLQGTLYPDVIESVSYKGPSATIKTHHNVGGLKDAMKLELIEPLRELFKDEVRAMGLQLGVPAESVWRHPFPGPGLAIRVLGEVTEERLAKLRQADAIFLEELRRADLYGKTAQAFAVLLPVKSVGVMGDSRVYADVIALRAVQSVDYMTADWFHMPYEVLARMSTRIINEVHGVSRVTYDISSKPPATIEWE